MEIIIIICVVAYLFTVILFYFIDVSVHKSMTRDHSTRGYGNGTFENFLAEFKKYQWKRKPNWPESFFDYSTDSEIHAGIVKFEGRGMVFNFWEYWKFQKWLKENMRRQEVIWKNL